MPVAAASESLLGTGVVRPPLATHLPLRVTLKDP